MKKSLMALAILAACGGAHAQSSVTLFGVVDTGVSRYSGEGTGTVRAVTAGNNASTRLGFRGVEDLGGGLSASFWLEAGVNSDDGRGSATNVNNQRSGGALAGIAGGQGLTFNRRSTVSIAGSWGELRLGRDYVPAFWNWTVYDPFGLVGAAQASNILGANTTVTNARASNSVGYFSPGCQSPRCDGFFGQVMYAMGENVSGTPTSQDGNHTGARIGYAAGPFSAAAATGLTKVLASGDFRQTNVGASWDFGVAKAMAQYGVNKSGVGGAFAGVSKATYYLLGATVPVGVGYIPMSYMHLKLDNANGSTARQLAVGYVYSLSKRTALYATYVRLTNANGIAGSPRFGITGGPAVASVNGTATGMDFGIRHSF